MLPDSDMKLGTPPLPQNMTYSDSSFIPTTTSKGCFSIFNLEFDFWIEHLWSEEQWLGITDLF